MDGIHNHRYPHIDMQVLPPSAYFSIGLVTLLIGSLLLWVTRDLKIFIISVIYTAFCWVLSVAVQMQRFAGMTTLRQVEEHPDSDDETPQNSWQASSQTDR